MNFPNFVFSFSFCLFFPFSFSELWEIIPDGKRKNTKEKNQKITNPKNPPTESAISASRNYLRDYLADFTSGFVSVFPVWRVLTDLKT